MEITHDIESALRPFQGKKAGILEFEPFGAILRIIIEIEDDEDWIVSFCDCTRVSFSTEWKLGSMKSTLEPGGVLRCEDSDAGFVALCRRCFIIQESESYKEHEQEHDGGSQ